MSPNLPPPLVWVRAGSSLIVTADDKKNGTFKIFGVFFPTAADLPRSNQDTEKKKPKFGLFKMLKPKNKTQE